MKKAPQLPEKKPSVIASIVGGIGGFILLGLLLYMFYGGEPVAVYRVDAIEAPGLQSTSDREWLNEEGVNLPPAGSLPSLQSAMRGNDELRRRVEAFAQKDDAEIFANYKQTDADIAAILLLWSGAPLNDTSRTSEGTDARVDQFIRMVYAMPMLERIANNPRLGPDPWPRLFAHYKLRLIAQTPGGQAPFTGGAGYDLERDRVIVSGGLSRPFFSSFGRFVSGQRDAAGFRNNLLRYVEASGIALNDADRQTLALVR